MLGHPCKLMYSPRQHVVSVFSLPVNYYQTFLPMLLREVSIAPWKAKYNNVDGKHVVSLVLEYSKIK